MREDITAFFLGLRDSIAHYIGQLMFGTYTKAGVAAIATFFTDILYGDATVFGIYMALALADLFLGILKARVYGTFNTKYLLYWVRKVTTYMVLVLVVGLLCQSLFRASGYVFYAVNWMFFFCSLTEAASIVDNLRKLGCPIHPVIDKLMKVLRKKAAQHITSGLEDPDFCKQVEEALGKRERQGGQEVPPCPK